MLNLKAAKTAALGCIVTLPLWAASAYAAVPQEVKTSIEASKTDGLEAGWIVVGVVAALFVIGIVKRMIR
ncbi:hypothetical protein H9Q10_06815 [Eikenella sp. S3360]|uniref:Phage coat protein n=1 Tax=Eikenella glucosivorans TaxID=2766967 RepID=A0ABS0NAV7_9NEIS|nr:major capsid protein [Eikenella glucosivorans]MBH5329379.1 hypothetical protein [Eikenella glucosivorans]